MPQDADANRVFETAAELFGLLAAPVRLKIISAVCQGERNVSDLLQLIGTTQPNLSQHLGMLHRAGIVSRRREGAQVFYGIRSERAATLCRAVCSQVALDLDAKGP